MTVFGFRSSRIFPIIFFIIFLCIGLTIYKDYGATTDEWIQRKTGLFTLTYLAHFFKIEWLLQGAAPIANPEIIFLQWPDRDYGVLFETPAEFLISLFGITGADIYFFRHFLTFLCFFIACIVFYHILKNRFNSWKFGLIGTLFLILSPRIFADAFYNDKDLVFLSFFIFATASMVRMILRPTYKNCIFNALICAWTIDIRLMGLVLPVFTLFFFCLYARNEGIKSVLFKSLTYLAFLSFFVVLFWPWLWHAPLENFLIALKNMSNVRWGIPKGAMSFMFLGGTVSANRLPWNYILVWISFTTPILYTLLSFIGMITIIGRIKRLAFNIRSSKNDIQDLIFLAIFICPISAVIIFNSVLYSGWRHLYFIYPAFIYLATYGLFSFWQTAKNWKFGKFILAFAIIAPLSHTLYWMIKWHPNQHLYFNLLESDWNKSFDMDYWGAASRAPLENIIKNNPHGQIRYFDFGGISFPNFALLSSLDASRLELSQSEQCSDFILTTEQNSRSQYLAKKEFKVFDELIVDDRVVYTTFERRQKLSDDLIPVVVNKPVIFSNPNTRCFMNNAWSSTEEWGVWSLGSHSELIFVKPESAKLLAITLRGLPNFNKQYQELKLCIIQNCMLKNIIGGQDTEVIIKIPHEIQANSKVVIDLYIKDPIAPKKLGISEDNRLLGVGLVSAVFR
jgi:hypothetical protein